MSSNPTAEQLRLVAALGDAIRYIIPGAQIVIPAPKPEDGGPDTEQPAPEQPPEEKPKPDVTKLLAASIVRLIDVARRCFTVIDADTMPDGTPLAQSFYEQQPADDRDWIGELENELAETFRGAANAGFQFILVSPKQPIEYTLMPDGAVRLSASFGVLKEAPVKDGKDGSQPVEAAPAETAEVRP